MNFSTTILEDGEENLTLVDRTARRVKYSKKDEAVRINSLALIIRKDSVFD